MWLRTRCKKRTWEIYGKEWATKHLQCRHGTALPLLVRASRLLSHCWRRGSESNRKRHFSGPEWPNRPHGSTYLCHRWCLLSLSHLVSVLVSASVSSRLCSIGCFHGPPTLAAELGVNNAREHRPRSRLRPSWTGATGGGRLPLTQSLRARLRGKAFIKDSTRRLARWCCPRSIWRWTGTGVAADCEAGILHRTRVVVGTFGLAGPSGESAGDGSCLRDGSAVGWTGRGLLARARNDRELGQNPGATLRRGG